MNHTLREILSQPHVWEKAIQEAEQAFDKISLLRSKLSSDGALFAGCGSTYYLSQVASALFRKWLGIRTTAVASGDFLLYREDYVESSTDHSPQSKPVLVSISRSGKTTETVELARKYRAEGGQVLAVTNYPDSPLVSHADVSLVVREGREESVVQTRSFSSMLVALSYVAALLSNQPSLCQAMKRLPESGASLIEKYSGLAYELGTDLSKDRFYFLGSGIRFGIASEASLKMKEVSLSHSEPFQFLEFRHGPMSMVNHQTVLFGLLSSKNSAQERAVLEQMRAAGAKVVALGESNSDIVFHSGIPEDAALALYLPVLQLTAVYRAQAKGLDPDNPNNLSAVVTLDPETLGG